MAVCRVLHAPCLCTTLHPLRCTTFCVSIVSSPSLSTFLGDSSNLTQVGPASQQTVLSEAVTNPCDYAEACAHPSAKRVMLHGATGLMNGVNANGMLFVGGKAVVPETEAVCSKALEENTVFPTQPHIRASIILMLLLGGFLVRKV